MTNCAVATVDMCTGTGMLMPQVLEGRGFESLYYKVRLIVEGCVVHCIGTKLRMFPILRRHSHVGCILTVPSVFGYLCCRNETSVVPNLEYDNRVVAMPPRATAEAQWVRESSGVA